MKLRKYEGKSRSLEELNIAIGNQIEEIYEETLETVLANIRESLQTCVGKWLNDIIFRTFVNGMLEIIFILINIFLFQENNVVAVL